MQNKIAYCVISDAKVTSLEEPVSWPGNQYHPLKNESEAALNTLPWNTASLEGNSTIKMTLFEEQGFSRTNGQSDLKGQVSVFWYSQLNIIVATIQETRYASAHTPSQIIQTHAVVKKCTLNISGESVHSPLLEPPANVFMRAKQSTISLSLAISGRMCDRMRKKRGYKGLGTLTGHKESQQ